MESEKIVKYRYKKSRKYKIFTIKINGDMKVCKKEKNMKILI